MSYFAWLKKTHKCSCGWSGPASELDEEGFEALFVYYCPKCGTRLGMMSYPTDREIRASASGGDEAATEMVGQVEAAEAYARRVMESRITSARNLKSVPHEEVEVVLHLEDVADGTFLVISANGVEIGREYCFFEDPEPAVRLRKILETKFRRRLRSIDWRHAELYLCGDRTSNQEYVSKVLKKYDRFAN